MDAEQMDAEEKEPFRYRLADAAIARRALFGALAETVSATAPPLFVLLVLGRLAVAPPQYLAAGAALLVVLALARAWTTRQRLKRHLKQFVVEVGPLDVVIGTLHGEHRVPRPAIERIREIPGVLGGLRLDLTAGWDGKDDSPEIVDVPRGGRGLRRAARRPRGRPPHRASQAREDESCASRSSSSSSSPSSSCPSSST